VSASTTIPRITPQPLVQRAGGRLARRRRDEHLERAQRLRRRVVQLARDVRALLVPGADHLRGQVAHPHAVGGEVVEELVQRVADAHEVAVGQPRARHARPEVAGGDPLGRRLELAQREERPVHERGVHDQGREQRRHGDLPRVLHRRVAHHDERDEVQREVGHHELRQQRRAQERPGEPLRRRLGPGDGGRAGVGRAGSG
jgi:hypothetical protein